MVTKCSETQKHGSSECSDQRTVKYYGQFVLQSSWINLLKPTGYVIHQQFNLLNTKLRLLYLKTQFVPRSKHFISVIKTNQFML